MSLSVTLPWSQVITTLLKVLDPMFCIRISISKPCRIEFSVSPYCSLLSHLKFWWSGDLYRQHEIQSRRSAVSGVSINGPPPLATKVLWYYMKSIMPILWHGNSWWCLILNQLIGSSGSVLFTLCSRGSPRSQDEVYLLPDLGIELGTFCRPPDALPLRKSPSSNVYRICSAEHKRVIL